MTIEISESIGAVWTITFLNTSEEKPTPTVWVCVDNAAFMRAAIKLAGMGHIKVIQAGPSHVETGDVATSSSVPATTSPDEGGRYGPPIRPKSPDDH